ncbi:MAG: alpha/beta hydrolase [Planctomycetes bacterium]|nr:alpha/beta hydrolase [Planctomycetota bacterium]
MTPKSPVVYLPGIDGTGRLLFRQERLNAEFAVRCVSYPQDDRHTYADLVKLGVRALEETGPGVVLAESFGGAVALMVALERPDLVRRLVLVNTFARYPRRLFIDVAGLVGPWLPMRPPFAATRTVRGWFFFEPGVARADSDAWWERTKDVPLRVYGHRCRLLRDVNLLPRLCEVRAPAVVFVAPNDRVVPAPAGRVLARLLPRAKRIELSVGHAGLIDPRVDVAAWLTDESLWR